MRRPLGNHLVFIQYIDAPGPSQTQTVGMRLTLDTTTNGLMLSTIDYDKSAGPTHSGPSGRTHQ